MFLSLRSFELVFEEVVAIWLIEDFEDLLHASHLQKFFSKTNCSAMMGLFGYKRSQQNRDLY